MQNHEPLKTSFGTYSTKQFDEQTWLYLPMTISTITDPSIIVQREHAKGLEMHLGSLIDGGRHVQTSRLVDKRQASRRSDCQRRRTKVCKAKPTCNNRTINKLTSGFVRAIDEGVKSLLDQTIAKLAWSEDIEKFKPNEGDLDVSQLLEPYSLYESFMAIRLRQVRLAKACLSLVRGQEMNGVKACDREYDMVAKLCSSVVARSATGSADASTPYIYSALLSTRSSTCPLGMYVA